MIFDRESYDWKNFILSYITFGIRFWFLIDLKIFKNIPKVRFNQTKIQINGLAIFNFYRTNLVILWAPIPTSMNSRKSLTLPLTSKWSTTKWSMLTNSLIQRVNNNRNRNFILSQKRVTLSRDMFYMIKNQNYEIWHKISKKWEKKACENRISTRLLEIEKQR